MVAGLEGVYCEPASAAGVAGLIKLHKTGYFQNGETVVCTLTGHGLKDADFSLRISQKPTSINSNMDDLVDALGF